MPECQTGAYEKEAGVGPLVLETKCAGKERESGMMTVCALYILHTGNCSYFPKRDRYLLARLLLMSSVSASPFLLYRSFFFPL